MILIKPWTVDVDGFGRYSYFAASRGKAMAKAFGDLAALRHGVTFKDFLKIARCRSQAPTNDRFGEALIVCGRPAFYVSHNSQYIQIVRPDSDVILNAHPLDVEPPEARRGTPYYTPP